MYIHIITHTSHVYTYMHNTTGDTQNALITSFSCTQIHICTHPHCAARPSDNCCVKIKHTITHFLSHTHTHTRALSSSIKRQLRWAKLLSLSRARARAHTHTHTQHTHSRTQSTTHSHKHTRTHYAPRPSDKSHGKHTYTLLLSHTSTRTVQLDRAKTAM